MIKMGSVGDDDAVAKELTDDLKAEAPEAEVVKAEIHEVEVDEVKILEADIIPEAEIHKAGVDEAEVHEENVVDELAQKLSSVMSAGIDDREQVDSVIAPEPEALASDAAAAQEVRMAKRKLPEIKRFSARRSVGVEDPKTMGNDNAVSESTAPSTIRRQRGAQRLSARMNIGIDDRDTVDYGAVAATEDPKPVVENDTAVVIEEVVVSTTAPRQRLSVAERERLRLSGIKRNKDIVCLERIRGKLVNITEGLELHTGVFSRVEQQKLVDLVRELQAKGRRQELKGEYRPMLITFITGCICD